jgi:hypothetical protein
MAVTVEEIGQRVAAAAQMPLDEQVKSFEQALDDLEAVLAKAVPR